MKVGAIGGGNMGEAILTALPRAGLKEAGDLCVCDIDPRRRERLAREHGFRVVDNAGDVLHFADTVVLAVKPQDLDDLLDAIAGSVTPDHLLISIAAGKALAGIEARLPDGARVIRVMPNLPAVVGAGMSVYCCGRHASTRDRDVAHVLLASFGKVREMSEELFDAVTAVSGSGPAFFAYYAQALAEAGVASGIDAEAAEELAVQTMLGTARLLAEGVFADPASLIAAVSSKGGTTVAGMQVLGDGAVSDTVQHTIDAAARRSRELSG